ncbi:MAG: aminopeptidase [Calditrichaeota bacterium]|nr:aminopeptidase [Calditrichota bacterium]
MNNLFSSMTFRVFFLILLGGLLVGLTSRGEEGTSSDELAQRLVNQCARIQENEIVLISGGVRDVKLLEDVDTHVRIAGAFPLVTLNSDKMDRGYYDEVPSKYDTQFPELGYKLATMIDAQISISYSENSGLMSDVPPERIAAVAKSFAPISTLLNRRKVRSVNLGNGLNPTADRARQFGLSMQELAEVYWSGVNIDYAQLESIGNSIQKKLAGGKEIHITNPNGTDLKVQIEARPVSVSDGVISEQDVQQGGAACQVWLPAGEVYLVPVPGTAQGKVVVDRQFYQDKEIKGLELIFKDGKLHGMKAQSGLEPLQARYEVSGEGRDEFAFIDVGFNPNVRIPENSSMVAWMASGMIIVGFGNNTWAGGENESDFGISAFLPGSTLKVDGEVIVQNGVLMSDITVK